MTDRPVLLVDGPRAGQVIRIPEGVTRCMVVPPFDVPKAIGDYLDGAELNPLEFLSTCYQTRVFTILGRRFDIGWSGPGAVPDDEVVAEWLLSDAAKEASR